MEQDREDVDKHQGPDTFPDFVRNSSRVSGDISMSMFLTQQGTGVTDL
jgi:hypothetical protein